MILAHIVLAGAFGCCVCVSACGCACVRQKNRQWEGTRDGRIENQWSATTTQIRPIKSGLTLGYLSLGYLTLGIAALPAEHAMEGLRKERPIEGAGLYPLLQ
jgi:hypothetical protein